MRGMMQVCLCVKQGQKFNNTLIAVMSRSDAVVSSMNVLNPMKIDDESHSNICCDLNVQYMLNLQTVAEI